MLHLRERVSSSPRAETFPAIELVEVCKSFKSFQAVDRLSLTVNQGEIFGLLGPNGSGKTTTINMISGLTGPTSGRIVVLGHDVQHEIRQVRRLLGSVPQETALYEELTAWDNMDFHADLYGVPRKEKRQRIERMLELVQLGDRKDSRVRTFSGGMKRRLAIGRALLHDPQLLYLDEPTLGVDVQARRAIWDYCLSLRAQGKTVLLTTNYLEEAQILCDRVAIIDHGHLIVVDTPAALKKEYGGSIIELETAQPLVSLSAIQHVPGVKEVRQDGNRVKVTTTGADSIVAHVIKSVSQQSELRDLVLREPHLDEIFLHLTGTALRDQSTGQIVRQKGRRS